MWGYQLDRKWPVATNNSTCTPDRISGPCLSWEQGPFSWLGTASFSIAVAVSARQQISHSTTSRLLTNMGHNNTFDGNTRLSPNRYLSESTNKVNAFCSCPVTLLGQAVSFIIVIFWGGLPVCFCGKPTNQGGKQARRKGNKLLRHSLSPGIWVDSSCSTGNFCAQAI